MGVAPLHAPPGLVGQHGEPSVLTSHSRMSWLSVCRPVEAVKPAYAWAPRVPRSAGPVKSGVAGRTGVPDTNTEASLAVPSKSIHA